MKRLGLILCALVACAQLVGAQDQQPPADERPAPGAPQEPGAPAPNSPPETATAGGAADAPRVSGDAGAPSTPPEDAATARATDSREPGGDEDGEPEPTLPEDARPRLSLEVSPREGLLTGDVVRLTIRADARKDDDLAVPREQDFAPFDVLDRQAHVEEGRDRAVHVFELDLLALEPGDHILGPIRIRVVTADGQVGEVRTEPVEIHVGSVLGNEPNAEPKPATEPVQVWQDDYTLLWVLGALGLIVLTALLTLLLARWWRRRQREAAPPPPPRPAWEVALERLEELRRDREAAVAEGRVVEWVDRLSDTVREYLGHRYGFEGLESTTDEVLRELEGKKLIGIDRSEVAALLHDCDLVKFAKATFDAEQCNALLAAAFRIVRASAPQLGAPQPLQPPAAAAGAPVQAPPVAGRGPYVPPPGSTPVGATPATSPAAPAGATPAAPVPAPPSATPTHPDARWMPPPSAALPPTRELPAPTLEGIPPAELDGSDRRIPATRPPPAGADTLPETVLGLPSRDASPKTPTDPVPAEPAPHETAPKDEPEDPQ